MARKPRSLHRRQWVPSGLEDVFAFFARPENLSALTPSWLALRITTPGPLTMLDYEPPLGPLGPLIDALVIRRQLAAIFDYRRQRIVARFGAPTVASAR